MLRNSSGKSLLTLTDYQRVGNPKINGLLGADEFYVYASPIGSQSRSIQLDGGSQPVGPKGDQLRVHYPAKGANAKWVPSSPKNGKITIDYLALMFAIDYKDMEQSQLLPE